MKKAGQLEAKGQVGMSLPGFHATPAGLVADESLTREQWEQAGQILGAIDGRLMWYVGDWLNAGEDGGYIARGKLDEACKRFGIAYQTAANASSVCRKIQSSLRREDLTFTHHALVAGRDDAEQLLQWASQEKATVKQLRERKQELADIATSRNVVTDDMVICSDLSSLGSCRFGTIYADPPWKYGNQATRAATDNHYSTMSVAELCDMPIRDLAANDAHLHLWTTNAFLPDAFQVIEAWGFEYRSCFVWVKPQMGIGNYWRVSHEFLLLGIRGNAKRFMRRDEMSWAEISRGKHSAKPEEIRAKIEKVSPGPYLELFGRKEVRGWTVYGNQVEKMLIA